MSAWPRVRLDQCAEIISGATPRTSEPSYWDGDICWATPQDLSKLLGTYISDTLRKITLRGLESCAASVLPAESVLFSSRAPIGHTAINTIPMATNQGFKSFVPDRKKVDPKFLYYWLRKNRSYLEGLGNGATFKEVSKAVVARIEIELPPLPEQQRIAAILDKADALRAKRRAALKKLDDLTQSIFLNMFGDPATNPKGWPTKSLTEVAARKPNNGIFRKNDEYCGNGAEGLPVVWVEELFRGDVLDVTNSRRIVPQRTDIAKYGLKHGDILFCRSSLKLEGIAYNNVYLGEDDAALFECHIIRVSPKLGVVDPVYLNQVFRTPQMRAAAKSKSKTATMTTIDQASLGAIALPVPPISMQHAFNRKTKQLAAIRAVYEKQLREIDSLFAAVQHRAFRGDL